MSQSRTLHAPAARSRAGTSVAKALGSTTRAGIYDHLRDAGEERTVRDVASAFDLHPNVARTHLELLADAGLVAIGTRKHPGGGRPAKVYRARPDADARGGAPPASDPGASTLVTLLAGLLGGGGDRPLSQRAHEAAAAEGRRLVAALGDVSAPAADDEDALAVSARTAARALQPIAPDAGVLTVGEGWVDIVGVRGVFAAVAEQQPEVAEALERGLVAGALAAAGTPATLADAGASQSGEPVWRARRLAGARARASAPAATIDARGSQRERGVVQAMRAITRLRADDVLEVLTAGPGSPAAFARWADRAGHQLLGVERATDEVGRPAIRLLIRKGA